MRLTRDRVHRQPFTGHSERWWQERRALDHQHRDPILASLYRTQAWKVLRRQVLLESAHRCATQGCAAKASVVDHIRPHRGESDLFFDRDNLQAMCKPCHDRKTARHDGAFGRRRTPP
jgi:5-methylcytosine-specific restriction protein A